MPSKLPFTFEAGSLASHLVNSFHDDGFAGIEVISYSGRGMYGKQCVAVRLESIGQLFQLGYIFAANGTEEERENSLFDGGPAQPKIDNLGMGYVAYWPEATAEPTTEEPDCDDSTPCPKCGRVDCDSPYMSGCG